MTAGMALWCRTEMLGWLVMCRKCSESAGLWLLSLIRFAAVCINLLPSAHWPSLSVPPSCMCSFRTALWMDTSSPHRRPQFEREARSPPTTRGTSTSPKPRWSPPLPSMMSLCWRSPRRIWAWTRGRGSCPHPRERPGRPLYHSPSQEKRGGGSRRGRRKRGRSLCSRPERKMRELWRATSSRRHKEAFQGRDGTRSATGAEPPAEVPTDLSIISWIHIQPVYMRSSNCPSFNLISVFRFFGALFFCVQSHFLFFFPLFCWI